MRRKPKDKSPSAEPVKGRDRLPVTLSIVAGLFTYGAYLLTLAPGVSWGHHSEDSGDMITAAWVAGIAHPTGYPLFTMLGWVWTHAIPFGSVAWRMNAFSAFWGAMLVGIFVRVVWRSFNLLDQGAFKSLGRFDRGLASISAAFLLAFSMYVWQQAVITEVYSLNLFFTSLVTWILVELLAGAKEAGEDEEAGQAWEKRRGRLVQLLGLSWGFALTNHMMSIFLFPGVFLVLAFGNLGLKFREFLKGALCWALPLLCYLYMPIRASMNPVSDYGDPRTWDNFVWMVTGKQFKKIMFSLMPYQSLGQIMKYNSTPLQFEIAGAIAAFFGLIRITQARGRGITLLLIHCFMLVGSALFFLANYSIWDPEGYMLSINFAAAIWAAWLIALPSLAPVRLRAAVRVVVTLILIIAPITALAGNWKACDESTDREAMQFGEETFGFLEPNAIVMEARYERAFVFWYYRDVEYAKTRPDVSVVFVEHMVFQWGLDLLKRKYPYLKIPETPILGKDPEAKMAAWVIRNNIADRPIYIGATVNELKDEGYRFEAVGLMYRVYPPGTVSTSQPEEAVSKE